MASVSDRVADGGVPAGPRRRRLAAAGVVVLVVGVLGVAVFAATRPDRARREAAGVVTDTAPEPAAGPTSATTPPPVGWSALPDSPLSKRTRPITAWTGTELVIWGGEGFTTDVCTLLDEGVSRCGDQARNDGAAFDPVTDTWRMLPPAPLSEDLGSWPTYRGAWTGEELVVWGGPDAAGAAYDPEADTWRPIANGPLGPRTHFAMALVAGEHPEVVVAGGAAGSEGRPSVEVAAYDPATDSWRSLPDLPEGRVDPLVVHPHESPVLVLGGYAASDVAPDGNLRFPPALRLGATEWEELPAAPMGRVEAAVAVEDWVVVTGTDPRTPSDPAAVRAARLAPLSGTWTALAAPRDGVAADALWLLGDELLLAPEWGVGAPGTPVPRQVLGLDAVSGSSSTGWTELPQVGLFDGALDGVQGSAVVWTGIDLLVWGGGADGGYGADPVAVGARYRFADADADADADG
jgi:hypothetical protein